MSARVVILGGSFGGLATAHALLLRHRLGARVQVTLLDRRPQFVYSPSLVWVITGRRQPAELLYTRAALARAGASLRTTEVRELNAERREIVTNEGSIAWDFLVVALGAEPDLEAVPGAAGAGIHFHSLDGAQRWASALRSMNGGRVGILVGGLPFRCPYGPYEMALVTDGMLRRAGVRGGWSIDIYTPERQPMQACGPGASARLARLLSKRGVGVWTGRRPRAVEQGSGGIRISFGGGVVSDCDLLGFIPRMRAPQVLHDSGLLSADGWITPADGTLRTHLPRVAALGDVTSFGPPGGEPLPKLGMIAHMGGRVVADNLAADVLQGQWGQRRLKFRFGGLVATGPAEAALLHARATNSGVLRSRLSRPSLLGHLMKGVVERRLLRPWRE